MRRRPSALLLVVLALLVFALVEAPGCKRSASSHGQPTPFPAQAFTPLPRVPTPTLRPGQAPQPTEFPG